nr:hypothetical protein [Tanacetum cinerariifolium]
MTKSQRVLWDAYGPIGPICTARHGGTTFTDYIPGPEAPPSPDYIPGPEDDADDEEEEESSESEEEEEEHQAPTVPTPALYIPAVSIYIPAVSVIKQT